MQSDARIAAGGNAGSGDAASTAPHHKQEADHERGVPAGGPPEPFAAGADYCARRFSVDVRTWRRWDAAGLIPAGRRIGGRRLWEVSELEAWFRDKSPNRADWERHRRREGGR